MVDGSGWVWWLVFGSWQLGGERVPTRTQQLGLIILLVALAVYVFVKLA